MAENGIGQSQVEDWNVAEQAGFSAILGVLELVMRADFALRPEKTVELRKNESYRSIHTVMQEAVDKFQAAHPEVPVTYTRDEGYVTLQQFAEMGSHQLTEDELVEAIIPFELQSQLVGKTVKDAVGLTIKYGGRLMGSHKIKVLRQLLTIAAPESFKKIVFESSGYTIGVDLGKVGATTKEEEKKKKLRKVMGELESVVAQDGTPQSISFILEKLLVENDGHLDEAVNQLAWLVKYVTRNPQQLESNLDWTRLHILDEFSPYMSYQYVTEEHPGGFGVFGKMALQLRKIFVQNNPPEIWADASHKNQIGKLYHAAYIMSLLKYCQPEVVGLMVAAEFAASGPGHGANKAMADTLILQNIKRINSLFARFAPTATPAAAT